MCQDNVFKPLVVAVVDGLFYKRELSCVHLIRKVGVQPNTRFAEDVVIIVIHGRDLVLVLFREPRPERRAYEVDIPDDHIFVIEVMHVGKVGTQRLNAVVDKGDMITLGIVVFVVAGNDEDVLVRGRALPQKINVRGLERGTDITKEADDIRLHFQHVMQALHRALQVGIRDDLEGHRDHRGRHMWFLSDEQTGV